MGGDPRNEDEAEEAPISVESATRAAKTAASLGRAPKPETTAKIGKYDLDKALEKSREDADPADAQTIAPPPGAMLDSGHHPEVEAKETSLDPDMAALLRGS